MQTKQATLFRLSNDVIQVILKESGCEIIFGSDHPKIDPVLKKRIVTYIDRARNYKMFNLKEILKFQKGPELSNHLFEAIEIL